MQSSIWAGILKKDQKVVEGLRILEGSSILLEIVVEYRDMPGGWRYAFCPGGPLFMTNDTNGANQDIYNLLGDYFKAKKCLFFRCEPDVMLRSSRFSIQKIKDSNPSTTTLIEVRKSETELLGAMHPKTRYNIRLAEKKGVQIVERKDLAEFMRLSRLTGGRDGFKLHDEAHYQAVLEADTVTQLSAEYQGKLIATMVLIGAGDTLTYLYGASDHHFRAVQAPALLQWRAIQLARERGYKWYDFFGIAPNLKGQGTMSKEQAETESKFEILNSEFDYRYDPNHQYTGVTRFKLGFGGVIREKPGTYDLILNPRKYRMYELLRKIRRWF